MANDRIPQPETDDPVEAIKAALKGALVGLKRILKREDDELKKEFETVQKTMNSNTNNRRIQSQANDNPSNQ